MEILTQINKWLNELLYRSDDITEYFKFKEESFERHSAQFYTKNNKYYLIFGEDYLGCTVQNRKTRAGEDWLRGSGLPDGDFSQETWDRIKNAIVSYELVKIAKNERSQSINPTEDKNI